MIRRRPGNGTAFGPRTATWFFGAIVVAILGILLSQTAAFAPIGSGAVTALSPFRSALGAAASPIDDFFENFGEFGDIKSANDALQAENERLSVEVAELREIEASYNDLEKLLDVKASRPEDTFVAASVVMRSAGRYDRAIAVNRGSSDGIVEGMVVLSPGGSVVGRVSSVLDGFSWVRLINDPTSRIPALLQDTRADGVLAGKTGGELRLDLLPQGTAVQPGEIIVTSGLGAELPKGLPLGKVVDVGGSDQDLFPTVFVEPLASLRTLENVMILTSFAPGGVVDIDTAEDGESSGSPDTSSGRAPEAALPGSVR